MIRVVSDRLVEAGGYVVFEVTSRSKLTHNYCLHLSSSLSTIAYANPLKRKSLDDGDGSLHASGSKKKKPLTNERREERNMREKERSLKITQQIHELRNLLSSGGVIVPKVGVLDSLQTL